MLTLTRTSTMHRYLTIALLASLLAACATTPEERRAEAEREAARLKETYGPTCDKLGYQPDSNKWRDCLLQLEDQRLMQQEMLMDRSYWGYPGYWPYYYSPGCFRRGGRLYCR